MNKQDLINFVATNSNLTKADSERAVSAVFQGIKETLCRGERASFVGFGTFMTAERQARNGRNPRTGAEIHIPAARQPKFRPGKELRESVN